LVSRIAPAIDAGKHVVMVNVEADVLAGPALAVRAREKGIVTSNLSNWPADKIPCGIAC
jgi:predicted homoserine dehydrogenase-like protein